ncbi:MAG: carboxypeptidase regulatory-like domain-containing protein, partial [Candidatus Hydrogenedentes bacterium]|nr:carboxypeptidase regulatory-like domain-containing protein [Candidatus Hydrogenedentota bacterium]
LAKLGNAGFEEPATDKDGRFVLPNVPAGGHVALKVAHPSFAQEGVNDVAVGADNVTVTLYPGVVLQGEVVSRDSGSSVANAAVVIQNAQPPHDSTITTSDGRGLFSVRLKPGVYMYQAVGSAMRSAGWERLTLTGEESMPRVRVMVAGSGVISGKVRDAVSGDPVAGARVALETFGNAAAVVQTGPGGEFQIEAGAGENVIRLQGAPGFLPPQDSNLRLTIEDGQKVELPDWFLAPLPTYHLQVIDGSEAAVAGAIVNIERPLQFGTYTADADGKVSFRVQSLPADGRLIGCVEHPSAPLGAVFALKRSDAPGARVQLLPLSSVAGRVLNGRGKGLEGVVVGGVFPGEQPDEELLLWRTITDESGAFQWPAVVPGLPQRCAAFAGGEATGQSEVFSLEPGSRREVADIRIDAGESGASLLGEHLNVEAYPVICGEVPADGAGLYLFASVAEAPAYAAALGSLRASGRSTVALIVPGSMDCTGLTVPVLRGAPPARATTYVTDAAGNVVLETFGIPPLHLLAAGDR